MNRLLLAGLSSALLCSGMAYADQGFTPNGSIGLTQTFYGNSGGYKTKTAHPSLSLNYNFAPKWNLNLVWDRTWGLYEYTDSPNEQYEYYSQPAGTLTYDYGRIGNSKVNWSSSFHLENQTSMTGSSDNYVYGQTFFDFSDYIPKSDFIEATRFSVAPQYLYGWNSKGAPGHVNTTGLALLTHWKLPANFSVTLNAYALRDWYTGGFELSGPGGTYNNANYFIALAWLQYQKTLYKFDQATSLGFSFTGGLDPFMSSNRNASWSPFIAINAQYEWLDPTVQAGSYKSTYILFALPQLTLTYNVNKKFSLNFFVGLKYSNQIWGETEGAWSFTPQGGFGMTYNF